MKTYNPEYIPLLSTSVETKTWIILTETVSCSLLFFKTTIHTKFSKQIKHNKEFPPKIISIAHRKTEGIWRKSPYHKMSFGWVLVSQQPSFVELISLENCHWWIIAVGGLEMKKMKGSFLRPILSTYKIHTIIKNVLQVWLNKEALWHFKSHLWNIQFNQNKGVHSQEELKKNFHFKFYSQSRDFKIYVPQPNPTDLINMIW